MRRRTSTALGRESEGAGPRSVPAEWSSRGFVSIDDPRRADIHVHAPDEHLRVNRCSPARRMTRNPALSGEYRGPRTAAGSLTPLPSAVDVRRRTAMRRGPRSTFAGGCRALSSPRRAAVLEPGERALALVDEPPAPRDPHAQVRRRGAGATTGRSGAPPAPARRGCGRPPGSALASISTRCRAERPRSAQWPGARSSRTPASTGSPSRTSRPPTCTTTAVARSGPSAGPPAKATVTGSPPRKSCASPHHHSGGKPLPQLRSA